jgi:Mrp family chromosome partitioning ATPase
LLDRFPLSARVVVLFVGAQGNSLTASTCASVAKKLAELRIGEILLVDSSAGRELSRTYQESDSIGLNNLLKHDLDWKSLIRNLPTSGLDFLPAGTTHWEHWGAEQKLRTIAAEMKRHYQFICVSADDANVANSKIWTGICDGSFLLVSLKNANHAIAESAVVELQTSGARLLGCIVTEADSTVP